ncbi:hypothetical protein ACFQYP_22935 [Nonomuraea antimicrobica]
MVERRLTMSAHDYLGYLSTVSAYLMLPPVARSRCSAGSGGCCPRRSRSPPTSSSMSRVGAGNGNARPDLARLLSPARGV